MISLSLIPTLVVVPTVPSVIVPRVGKEQVLELIKLIAESGSDNGDWGMHDVGEQRLRTWPRPSVP